MLIAQGAANDDPRVYRPNSMYEVPIDLYALYGAYDDNLYLMWEMTNVQDVVDRGDDYPLSQEPCGRPRTCRSPHRHRYQGRQHPRGQQRRPEDRRLSVGVQHHLGRQAERQ